MKSRPGDTLTARRNSAPLATYGLMSLCIVVGLFTLFGVFAGAFLLKDEQNQMMGIGVVALFLLLVFGFSGCALILAAIAFLRRVQTLLKNTATIDQRTSVLAEQSVANNRDVSNETIPLMDPSEEVRLLEEIREILLLPEQSRNRRFKHLIKGEFQKHLDAAEAYVKAGEFHQAREQIKNLTERFGSNEQVKNFQERLEKAAQAAQDQEIRQGSEQIQDLLGLGQFEDAENLARELTQKYPTAQEPARWLDRVQEERQEFEKQHRQELHDQIQNYVSSKDWISALESAHRFLETYPSGEDSDAIRQQTATLEANAEIQTRQKIENQYKDYLGQQKYWEALSLARHLISEYPLSPQANALRDQIGRVEELARQRQKTSKTS